VVKSIGSAIGALALVLFVSPASASEQTPNPRIAVIGPRAVSDAKVLGAEQAASTATLARSMGGHESRVILDLNAPRTAGRR
jgi:hypothetical protein